MDRALRPAVFASVLLVTVAAAEQIRAAPPSAKSDAARLYEQGAASYEVLDYDRAIECFKKAYLLTRAPELLFNIAQAYRRKGPAFCDEALTLFKSYQPAETDPSRRANVAGLVKEMQRCVEENARSAAALSSAPTATNAGPASADAPRTAQLEPQPSAPLNAAVAPAAERPRSVLAPSLLTAGGAVLLGGGAVLWAQSHATFGQLQTTCSPYCTSTQVQPAQVQQGVGLAAGAVGAALVASALYLWLAR